MQPVNRAWKLTCQVTQGAWGPCNPQSVNPMVKGQTSCRCSSPDIPKHRDLHRIYARALTDRFSHTITRHFLGCPPRRVHLFPAWDEDDAAVREIALAGSPGGKAMPRREAAAACRTASTVLAAPTKTTSIGGDRDRASRCATPEHSRQERALSANRSVVPSAPCLRLCLARRLYVRAVPAEGRRGHACLAEVAVYPAALPGCYLSHLGCLMRTPAKGEDVTCHIEVSQLPSVTMLIGSPHRCWSRTKATVHSCEGLLGLSLSDSPGSTLIGVQGRCCRQARGGNGAVLDGRWDVLRATN